MTPDLEKYPWLAELNPQQLAAATFGEGPLLVVAGAGSGKTKTLAYRVAWLIASGVPPSRILLLTFTRRAAEEMIRRANLVVAQGTAAAGHVWGGTFHATCNRLLRLYATAAGLAPGFTVLDQGDAEDLMNAARHELGFSQAKSRFPRKSTCLAIYSRCVSGGDALPDVLQRHFPWCAEFGDELKALFRAYTQRKQAQMVLDYDDLLLYLDQLLQHPALAQEIGSRFEHVLVDEYQDTNPVQARILQGLRRTCRNLTVVGDDAQSIYSFRAATVRNMLDFPQQFPGATLVKLEQNYRSVTPILTATNAVIAQAKERFAKELWSTREEGQRPQLVLCRDEAEQDQFVVETILEHYEQGLALKRMAVLFRASHFADSLEIELTRRNLPYVKYGGLRFLEAAHVKDLISYLRLAENQLDELAWFRVLQLLKGMGPKKADAAIRHLKEQGRGLDALDEFVAPAAARQGLHNLIVLIRDMIAGGGEQPAADVERVRRYYEPILETTYENPQVRKRDLEHLEQIAGKSPTRKQFLSDLVLDPPTSTGDLAGPPLLDDDWLTLSTIHSAKGCEWDVVFLIHAADGCLPSDMATGRAEEIEEELRLTYVALTRARDFLYASWPLRYYHRKHRFGDAHSYSQLCRFLDHRQVKPHFDLRHFGRERERDDAASTVVVPDIAAKLNSRWD
jgi:DNA helicase-2/ATP-dependent DNA helicase PcrA